VRRIRSIIAFVVLSGSGSTVAAGCSSSASHGSPPPCEGSGCQDTLTPANVDCGGPNAPKCDDGRSCTTHDECASGWCSESDKTCRTPRSDDGVKNGKETDVDCGGPDAPKCAEGKRCLVDSDCNGACNYKSECVDAPSCKRHLGGDTCGFGEVGEFGARHESCCRTLPVHGYSDPRHPGKTVYLDKYEITVGRIRAFIEDIKARYGGRPDIRAWVLENTPPIWDPKWTDFLPSDYEGGTVRIDRRLLGDRREGPDFPPIPDRDQDVNVGLDYQFNGRLFVYLHGNNCSTHLPNAWGFPTFFYPAEVMAKYGPDFPPRADGRNRAGVLVPAHEHLEVKAMNCITNAMLAAFCHWDGGQLATNEVLDYVTGSPPSLGNDPGCGTQRAENPPTSASATRGGRCADLALVNATYDAGASLPEPDSPLNVNNYVFPFFSQDVHYDKAWEIAAPGRGSLAANGEQVDMVRLRDGDEPWMDLHGNLNEAVLTMDGARFTGKFGLKFRGIGYQSARSELNIRDDWEAEGGLRRIERAEAKAGFAGGRCMRFK